MSNAFCAYLDAKFPLDERSLNPAARSLFQMALQRRASAAVLDLGCGTGASLRRLLAAGGFVKLELTAIDRDAGVLAVARDAAVRTLREHGFSVAIRDDMVQAGQQGRQVTVRHVAADLQDFEPGWQNGYDAVIAHALMDLLPAPVMARRILDWLAPGGLFYATLNYDAGTTLFPPYRDAGLEAAVLSCYDASMERRAGGLTCGGAQTGRRLHAALVSAGYAVLAYGSSDWNITPYCGAYRDADEHCLTALLAMIHDEASRAGRFDPAALAAWHAQRQAQIRQRELGLIIHQIDLLGQKPVCPAPPFAA